MVIALSSLTVFHKFSLKPHLAVIAVIGIASTVYILYYDQSRVHISLSGHFTLFLAGHSDKCFPSYHPWNNIGSRLRAGSRFIPQYRADQREDGCLLVAECQRAQERLPK